MVHSAGVATARAGAAGKRSPRRAARILAAVGVVCAATVVAPGSAAMADPGDCGEGVELMIVQPTLDCAPSLQGTPTYLGPTFSDERAKVVTLGDSYSSGTGIWREDSSYDQQYGGYQDLFLYLTGRIDRECWREMDDTPGPRYAASIDARSIFLACKGAEVGNVSHQVTVMQEQWPLDAAAGWSGATILFTAGGNDLRTSRNETWPELLERCVIEINPFGGCHSNSKNKIKNFDLVEVYLSVLYSRIATVAPGATIRVMGYPRIMLPKSSGLLQCPHVTGITGNEARWIDQQVDRLNERIIKAVASTKSLHPAVDIEYVEVRPLMTVGACFGQSSGAHINDRVTAWSGQGVLLTSDASFHPTQLGYDVYHAAFVGSL